jgi:hypothetical protein
VGGEEDPEGVGMRGRVPRERGPSAKLVPLAALRAACSAATYAAAGSRAGLSDQEGEGEGEGSRELGMGREEGSST